MQICLTQELALSTQCLPQWFYIPCFKAGNTWRKERAQVEVPSSPATCVGERRRRAEGLKLSWESTPEDLHWIFKYLFVFWICLITELGYVEVKQYMLVLSEHVGYLAGYHPTSKTNGSQGMVKDQ